MSTVFFMDPPPTKRGLLRGDRPSSGGRGHSTRPAAGAAVYPSSSGFLVHTWKEVGAEYCSVEADGPWKQQDVKSDLPVSRSLFSTEKGRISERGCDSPGLRCGRLSRKETHRARPQVSRKTRPSFPLLADHRAVKVRQGAPCSFTAPARRERGATEAWTTDPGTRLRCASKAEGLLQAPLEERLCSGRCWTGS